MLITGDFRVPALVADESAVRPGYHLPELVIRDAVRATDYGRSHGHIHPTQFVLGRSPDCRGFYPVTIKGM